MRVWKNTGHSSATGAETLNERLSQLRAEYVKKQLERQSPRLRGRTIASGAGSRQNLLGTGKDDISDALDLRVEFQVHSCS
jgi:outer membrane protein OmpA-like peptidoglycan-associated protein